MRVLGQHEQAEAGAVGGDHPDTAGAADEQVAGRIDLDPVDGVGTGLAGEVDELDGVGQVAGGVDVVAHDDLVVEVPVADVQVALVGREGDPVRAGELVGQQRDLAVTSAEHAAERQLAVGVVGLLGEAERRVGEEQRAVGAEHQVVGAVQPPALVARRRAR